MDKYTFVQQIKIKMNEIGINGIRVYKVQGSDDIHLQFIWIEADELPDDYIGY